MDIMDLKNLLEVLASVGIEETILEPAEEGTLVRGVSKDLSILVYHTVPEEIVDYPMGIQSVKALLSRVTLFDTAKASITVESADEKISNLLFKQGKKKASYRCANVATLSVPKKIPGAMVSENQIEFSRSYVEQFDQAVSSMAHTGQKDKRYVSIAVKDNLAEVSIFDGEDDTFTDEIEVDYPDFKKATWAVPSFQRVLKQSLDENKEKAIFNVNEYGVAIFDLNYLDVLVAPFAR